MWPRCFQVANNKLPFRTCSCSIYLLLHGESRFASGGHMPFRHCALNSTWSRELVETKQAGNQISGPSMNGDWRLFSFIRHKSKTNNTAGLLAVRFLAAFSQPTYIVVSSLQLIHGPLVSLTDFLGSCAQAGCKLTARFSSLSSPLSSTSAFSRLTACYYTCSYSWLLLREVRV